MNSEKCIVACSLVTDSQREFSAEPATHDMDGACLFFYFPCNGSSATLDRTYFGQYMQSHDSLLLFYWQNPWGGGGGTNVIFSIRQLFIHCCDESKCTLLSELAEIYTGSYFKGRVELRSRKFSNAPCTISKFFLFNYTIKWFAWGRIWQVFGKTYRFKKG